MSTSFFENHPILAKIGIVLFSTVVIFSSAAACTFPFGGTNLTLGVLKYDPSARVDSFGIINNVKAVNGSEDPAGLSKLSGLKMIQYDQSNVYLLTKEKGLFVTDNGGKLWNRKYIFPITSNEKDANKKAEIVKNAIANNDTFIPYDVTVSATDKSKIFVAGRYQDLGKIYFSADGGDTFREVYSEVKAGVNVKFVAVDPVNPLTVYAALDGGSIIRSTDSGQTWTKLRAFSSEEPVQIGFIPENNNNFFVLLKNKGLAISSDSGNNFAIQDLKKTSSSIGESQPTTGISIDLTGQSFGAIEKIVPVPGSGGKDWVLIADSQVWYSTNISTPFKKLVLPLQSEQYNVLDATVDPTKGLNRIMVSVDSKIFETTNQGASWSADDKIKLSSKIGNIGQIIVDRFNPDVIYVMLVDPNIKRNNGFFF